MSARLMGLEQCRARDLQPQSVAHFLRRVRRLPAVCLIADRCTSPIASWFLGTFALSDF